MVSFDAKTIDTDYMIAWRKRTEYVLTTEQKAAFYTLERKAEVYARSFFCRLCERDFPSSDNLKIDGSKILPLTFLPREELQEEYNLIEGKTVCKVEKARFVRFGKPQRHCVQITLPICDQGAELTDETKEDIRHELIHYFLFIHRCPHRDDSALFHAHCHIYDGGAYGKLSKKEESKYNEFIACLNEEIDLPHYLQALLAEAVIRGREKDCVEYARRKEEYLQKQTKIEQIIADYKQHLPPKSSS